MKKRFILVATLLLSSQMLMAADAMKFNVGSGPYKLGLGCHRFSNRNPHCRKSSKPDELVERGSATLEREDVGQITFRPYRSR